MSNNHNSLYLPQVANQLAQEDLWRWFQNIPEEIPLLSLSENERSSFEGYYRSAGLLKDWRRPFFRHHYALPLLLAVRELFSAAGRPRILDLGCGTGTQSLLFALLGAEVVAVDMDESALEVFRKRKALYEKRSGRSLDINIRSGNVFEMDFQSLGSFTAVYSLFAFNLMQPTKDLLERLEPHLTSRAVMAIQDGNRTHFFNRIFRRRNDVASRNELRAGLQNVGFASVRHIGGYAIPPVFWRLVSARVLEPIDRLFTKSDLLAVSYLHVARRGD